MQTLSLNPIDPNDEAGSRKPKKPSITTSQTYRNNVTVEQSSIGCLFLLSVLLGIILVGTVISNSEEMKQKEKAYQKALARITKLEAELERQRQQSVVAVAASTPIFTPTPQPKAIIPSATPIPSSARRRTPLPIFEDSRPLLPTPRPVTFDTMPNGSVLRLTTDVAVFGGSIGRSGTWPAGAWIQIIDRRIDNGQTQYLCECRNSDGQLLGTAYVPSVNLLPSFNAAREATQPQQ